GGGRRTVVPGATAGTARRAAEAREGGGCRGGRGGPRASIHSSAGACPVGSASRGADQPAGGTGRCRGVLPAGAGVLAGIRGHGAAGLAAVRRCAGRAGASNRLGGAVTGLRTVVRRFCRAARELGLFFLF